MKRACLLFGLLLGACNRVQSDQDNHGAERPAAVENAAETQAAGTSGPGTNATAGDGSEPADTGTGALPPASRPLRFVGRWASEVANCRNRAWNFTASGLDTPAGSQCHFKDIRKVPGGYDIAARCTAEAPPRDDKISLRFAESAKAMLFESESIADAGLIYCGS